MFEQVLFLSSQGGAGNAGTLNLLMIGMIFAVFYFFMIRPQNQKVKEQESFLHDLEKGDLVITAGGIHGKISKINENIITLEVSKNNFIRVQKDSISKDMSQRLENDSEADN